ncbi:MAG: HAD hydrolase-like protein [Firmicutes bacterium]|jgi:phosphoglycolate phosphatase-like HAD superfamily hydrolase|nr:HAD hydrolase-like protein [Bacillota bacterium]
MNKKLILWDIDGTLMSCYNDGTLALNETFRRRTGHPNAMGEIIAGTSMDSSMVDMLMEKLGIDPSEKEALVGEFAEILTDIVEKDAAKKVLPGVREILERLSGDPRVLMGLITSNFKVGAMIKLDSVDLGHYFTFGGYGDHPGEKWDAAMEAVKQAEALNGGPFPKEDLFVIGDTRYDIRCAERIGATSVAVATGWMPYEMLEREGADYLLPSLADVEGFIELLGLD